MTIAHPQPLDIHLLQALGELTHQLQIERGYTALYVDSDGEIFDKELRDQYQVTDQAIAVLVDPATRTKVEYTSSQLANLENIHGPKSTLHQHRQSVQKREIEFAPAINPYTYQFLYPVIEHNIETAFTIKDVNPLHVSAYSNFLQWKERTGRERAWGGHGFCSKVFKNREFTERMLSLIEEQGAYKRAFMSLATEQQRREVNECLGGYVMACLDQIHILLKDTDKTDDLEALSPITWFELLTGKIDRMRQAELQLIASLNPIEAVPIAFTNTVPPRLEPFLPIIQSLPVFSKLSDTELADLLKTADIRDVEKNNLLFMQGETLSRYYLILEGWVKLYKSTETGDEAVLQMLSAGDSLMEAAVFLNIPSLVNAQVVQQAKLLSIPAPVIRQHLTDNRKLALNMIGGLSMRGCGLIRQIEHSRLKTATERVGWFLLKLGMEQHGGKANAIILPYDKSTIASYLDMTPETFSRTLKLFKNNGFRIQNDKITKPDPKALCPYCDDALAEACIYKDQELCPQTYLEN